MSWEQRNIVFCNAQTEAETAYIDAEREAARLQDENAKLHAELTDLRLGSCPSCGIKVENEELRELVRELLHHIEYPPCEGCLAEMSCLGDVSQCDEYVGWLKPRACELGIEVDE